MGCASSALISQNDSEFSQIGSSAFGQHIVSLTSTTYGLLSLDNTPPKSKPPQTQTPMSPPSLSDTPTRSESHQQQQPEVINSWELMAGLDTDSFRLTPNPTPPFPRSKSRFFDKENTNPNRQTCHSVDRVKKDSTLLTEKDCGQVLKKSTGNSGQHAPPGGDNKVVIYTTTLRGVRKTFEACNAVRAAIQGMGVVMCERDVSMDKGFREELKELMKRKEGQNGNNEGGVVLPQVFVKGRYVGGAKEVLRLQEEGKEGLSELLTGVPKVNNVGEVCDGCGGVRFLPCFTCSGSCKVVVTPVKEMGRGNVIVSCTECNENGLVLCPICC